jgi:cation transport regulator ChaC
VTAVTWYFAYGSNMQSATFRGRRGIDYRRAVAGRVPGWRIVFDKPGLVPTGNGFATIVADAAAEVLGVLYEIGDEDLAHVDLTEGVLIDNYKRIAVETQPLGGAADPVRAFTLTSRHRDPQLLPSTRYMRMLIEGAIEHGLPTDYVDFLRAVPATPESAEAQTLRASIDEFLRQR